MGKQTLVGLILIAVALIVFPIVLTGANTILTDTNIATYTGLETVVKIAPLLVLIGMVAAGGWLTFTGIRGTRKKARKTSRTTYR